ncbi:MAG: DHA2 family efflux MFS transporter permease subunit [Leptolyngbyaceae cyanobacterium SM1_3_5]|nr:DHA2 family efflux MFS transporter permease subunit [Leptolyngbyaceae cyanobacterium SM1_3_5]
MATPSLDRSTSLLDAWKVLGVTSLAIFAASLDSTVLFVAFPSIRATFPTVSVAQLSWVLNAYTIVFAAFLVFAGGLADFIGRRKTFLIGVTIFTLASVLCGLASSPALLISARVLQAIGGVLITPASLALVLSAFPHSKRATAVSLWGAVGAIAAAVGPSLGAAIVQTAGWRWAFFLNLPVGIVTIGLGRQILSESRQTDSRKISDLFGVLLSIVAIGLIAFATVQSSEWGWNNRLTLLSLAGGELRWDCFSIAPVRVEAPAIDLKLFQNANYRFANLATFVFYIVFTAIFFGFVLFLTQVWGYSTLNAGLAITPGPLLVAVIAPFAGRIAVCDGGHRVLLVPGGILLAIGGFYLLTQAGTTPAFRTIWLPSTILIGMGVGLTLPILSSAAVHDLPPTQFAIGSAVNQVIRQLGSVFGVALVVVLVGKTSSQTALVVFDRLFLVPIVGGLLISALSFNIQTQRSNSMRGK